ncbi:hypothetical protein [Halococcus salifodinae]|uniref:Glucan 14-alpha-glucosidase n=1 Tax=Halococcus salifodinae DSM 8989 TaxID=1227456 RepID=M0MSW4_9EURY|nr:hypothetical protein [Halococcus salifodinae]EMA48438.1 glucan 14-alpha-glucosidase [Halococcus salifodinae DSM 8989]
MAFRRSLADYKQAEGDPELFPGERRTHSGLFAGSGRRLVHVAPTGAVRDYSYPLSGFHGITALRFGVRFGGTVHWFDDLDDTRQRYHGNTALVETVHRFDEFDIVQRDISVGFSHSTLFELTGDWPDDLSIVGFVEFFPDGQEGRVGQLIHDDEVVEVYHNREHDYLRASTELSAITPEQSAQFGEVLAETSRLPRHSSETDNYEGSRLTGGVSFRAAVEDGTTTIVTRLADIEDEPRSDSLAALADQTQRHGSPADVRAVAHETFPHVDATDELVNTDLRVLRLLSAPTGARIAGPEFDPYYQYSGGYGYTWFRDDAEIAQFLLKADGELGLGLADTHRKSAAFYLATQLDDGRWPHRVWPMNGRLAPGWANGHVEGNETHYQADQTASALVFLATYLSAYHDIIPEPTRTEIRNALARGVGGLDRSLATDGLPLACENAWENMDGRFTHTAAGFLHAYSVIATAPCHPRVRDHAAERARRIDAALDTMWLPDKGIYARRSVDGELDGRADSTTFSLIDAHLVYERIADVDDDRLRRLERHLDTTFNRLWKETDDIRGLTRFEADTWRQRTQDGEKVWTVSTGWGAYTAERAIELFPDTDEPFDAAAWSDRLFAEIDLSGSLCLPSGYLPEQFFDTGSPDSATPLGWSHGIRLATFAARHARNA